MVIPSPIIRYSKYDSIYSISTSISKNKIRKINSKNKIITDKVNDTKINFIILSFLKIVGKKLAQLRANQQPKSYYDGKRPEHHSQVSYEKIRSRKDCQKI